MITRSLVTSERSSVSPRVAIVVLNWNGWLDSIECLESILRSTRPFHRVIVCDNGSTDESLIHLKKWAIEKAIAFAEYDPKETTVHGDPESLLVFVQIPENLGYAGGNNVGIRYALEQLSVDYVWILNNDTVVDPEALRRLVDLADSDSSIGVIGAKLINYWDRAKIQALGGGLISRSGRDTQLGRDCASHPQENDQIDLDHVVGASMFVRAEAIRSVGYIDERFFLFREETDWCIKMRQSKWRLLYCPTAHVWHKEGASLGSECALRDYYAIRNMFFLVQKHYPQYLAFTLVYWVFRGFGPKLVRLQFRRMAYVWRAYRDFFRGIDGKSDTFARYWQLVHLTTRRSD